MVVNGVHSEQRSVTRGVPQGSVLGPVLFDIYLSDITKGLLGKVCPFADNTNVCNRVDVPGGVCNMKHDLALRENWSMQWRLQFNVSKCKVMHLGKNNALKEYNIGGTGLASTTEEIDLEVLISDNCKMSKQCDQAVGKVNIILGCITRGVS